MAMREILRARDLNLEKNENRSEQTKGQRKYTITEVTIFYGISKK